MSHWRAQLSRGWTGRASERAERTATQPVAQSKGARASWSPQRRLPGDDRRIGPALVAGDHAYIDAEGTFGTAHHVNDSR